MPDKVAVVGATGFVGSAVAEALGSCDCNMLAVRAPRLRTRARLPATLLREAAEDASLAGLVEQFRGARAVINAAGNPDASSLDDDGLVGGNALLPAVVAEAARRAGVPRLVHVSSAVVQNDVAVLGESEELRPFSPYSLSKVLGEQVLREASPLEDLQVVRFRPPSVHAPGRRVTQMIARVARSPLASVAGPGSQPTPQALLPNVANAIAFLATCVESPPPIVAHPSEGVTCANLMIDLSGGRRPRHLPRSLARMGVALAKGVGHWHRPTAANARRLELLWLGQQQAPSWLDGVGWRPPSGREAWQALGRSAGGPV